MKKKTIVKHSIRVFRYILTNLTIRERNTHQPIYRVSQQQKTKQMTYPTFKISNVTKK